MEAFGIEKFQMLFLWKRKKMLKKHITGWNSITKRIVLILILLILPFNIVSIVTTMHSLRNARRQTLSVMENLSALAVQQMDSRLLAMNDFSIIWTELIPISVYIKNREYVTESWSWRKRIWHPILI